MNAADIRKLTEAGFNTVESVVYSTKKQLMESACCFGESLAQGILTPPPNSPQSRASPRARRRSCRTKVRVFFSFG